MENERSSLITIGGEKYEMVLTTRATKKINLPTKVAPQANIQTVANWAPHWWYKPA